MPRAARAKGPPDAQETRLCRALVNRRCLFAQTIAAVALWTLFLVIGLAGLVLRLQVADWAAVRLGFVGLLLLWLPASAICTAFLLRLLRTADQSTQLAAHVAMGGTAWLPVVATSGPFGSPTWYVMLCLLAILISCAVGCITFRTFRLLSEHPRASNNALNLTDSGGTPLALLPIQRPLRTVARKGRATRPAADRRR